MTRTARSFPASVAAHAMRFVNPCIDADGRATPPSAAAVVLAALAVIFSAPAAAPAQQPGTPAQQPAGGGTVEADPAAGDPGEPLTFLDTVTVSATLRPAPVRETPGMVSVIDDEVIQGRLVENVADLVKYEPGVYVVNDVTRFGLNGFNVRGVGGNRVMTQLDGVQTSEQFDFGPLNVFQASVDLDTLKSVEIVRSANSALYGSDALGGVVSLFTKDPADWLGGRRYHVGAKTTWDGRAGDLSGNLAVAAGAGRLQASLFTSAFNGHEVRNQGEVETEDAARTAPNPQDRRGLQALAKLVFTAAPGNVLRAAAETYDTTAETAVFSSQGSQRFGPALRIDTTDYDAVDDQERLRFSFDQTLVGRGGLDQASWRVHHTRNDTSQVVDDTRTRFGFGPFPIPSERRGTLDYDQDGVGLSLQGRKGFGGGGASLFVTAGADWKRDRFDILRNVVETDPRSGAVLPPRGLTYPTKYFPRSAVAEAGAYFQVEALFGRVTVVPGFRYDRYALDADQQDPVFLAGGHPTPADFADDAISPKLGAAVRLSDALTLHAQYAGGFRAPPYSSVNTGFTNFSGGYTTLPNAELRAETSDNVELGLRAGFDRASFGVTAFSNRYDDFIELATLGPNRATGLLEFQNRNVEQVTIAGVEVRGEAYLTDSVVVRGSYASIDGDKVSAGEPLPEIAPDEGVLGIRYAAVSGRWGSELSVRGVAAKAPADAGEDQFAPGAWAVADLTGFVSLAEAVRLRVGLLNLTDAKYFPWWHVRGRPSDDPVIDRYSSPGRSAVVSLAYDW